jgi:hypothetical protein
MSRGYIASLADPFDVGVPQPKLLDGSVMASSGLKFRTTGDITLDGDGSPIYICLIPGFSNALTWQRFSDAAYVTAPPNANHVDSVANRNLVAKLRMVSVGLRMNILNSADENEGYFEAVRITLPHWTSFTVDPVTAAVAMESAFTSADMANNSTYQSGKLKDIGRFQFKLNSTDPVHRFKPGDTEMVSTVSGALDEAFDVIIFKINGRVNATTPTVIKYDVVSNQEMVYLNNTLMYRLATPSPLLRGMDVLLEKTKYMKPGIQIM